MIKVLTYVALTTTILAAGTLFAINQPYSIKFERAGEVKKDQEKAASPAPSTPPAPFGPVPNVVVQSVPAPPPVVSAPTPAQPVKRQTKRKKSGAVKKLQSKWVEPKREQGFSFDELFRGLR